MSPMSQAGISPLVPCVPAPGGVAGHMDRHAALQPGPRSGSVHRLRSAHRHLQDPAVSQQTQLPIISSS